MNSPTHCLEVRGNFACFSRPEMKVARYSYPIITPSAARGIFDAIYLKLKFPNKPASTYRQTSSDDAQKDRDKRILLRFG